MLVVIDADGNFPIQYTYTLSEMCREAENLYGSHRLAAEQLGRSHKFIGRQFIERSKRYKGRKRKT